MYQGKHLAQQCSSRQPLSRGEEALQNCKKFRRALRRDILKNSRQRLNRIYGVNVRSIDTTSMSCSDILKNVKQWMEGPEVNQAFRRKGRKERCGGKMSFRLLKKILPPPCKCLSSHFQEEWSKGRDRGCEGDLPDDFLRFVKKTVSNIFRPGWDRNYIDSIGQYQPKSSACVERPCCKGGSRAELTVDKYVEILLADPIPLKDFQYQEVRTSGKVRPLTVAPVELNVLRPMHKCIYNVLRKQKWCLTGPPDSQKLERAGFLFKNKILSGDYKGATDNLDLRVSELILSTILDSSYFIPDNHKDFAMRSLHPTVQFKDGARLVVNRGQMMGSLLSFPLLCLYNFVTSRYALGKVPMLINGDDLVAETRNPCRWFEVLPLLGLEPEKSKTGYSKSTFEINSTPFLIKDGKPVRAPVCRMGTFSAKPGIADIGGGLTSFIDGLGPLSNEAISVYMEHHSPKAILAIKQGVPVSALGFSGDAGVKACFKYLSPLAWRLSPNFARPVFPSDPAETHSRVSRVFGQVPRDIRVISRRLLLAEALGEFFPKVDSKKTINRWWEKLKSESSFLASVPINKDLVRKMLGGTLSRHKQASPRYGELYSKLIYYRRLKGSILSKVLKPSVVHSDVLESIPALTRWGITVDGSA